MKAIPKFTTGCYKVRRCLNCIRYKKITRKPKGVTIISQNCVGGVIYNFFGMRFDSPFINMYLEADDFFKLVNDLEDYMQYDPVMVAEKPYLLCRLNDIFLHCLHYKNYDQLIQSWKERRQRMNYKKILVVMTDRDGFEEKHFEQFQKIIYPKVLLTAHPVNNKDVYYLRAFKNQTCVGTVTDFQNIFGKKYFEAVDFGTILSNIISSAEGVE